MGPFLPCSFAVGEETAGDEAVWRETHRSIPATWFINPIDGTANFAVGIRLFGIMVALVERAETTQAWIYDPNIREMATEQRGAGACLGELRIGISDSVDTSTLQGSLSTCFAGDDTTRQHL